MQAEKPGAVDTHFHGPEARSSRESPSHWQCRACHDIKCCTTESRPTCDIGTDCHPSRHASEHGHGDKLISGACMLRYGHHPQDVTCGENEAVNSVETCPRPNIEGRPPCAGDLALESNTARHGTRIWGDSGKMRLHGPGRTHLGNSGPSVGRESTKSNSAAEGS
jgi:hypothetical protein